MGDFYRLDCGHDLAEGETIADPCPTCRLIAKVRREALEEAARVAEVYQDPRGYGDYASDVITARIRALKEKDGRRHPCAEGGTGMSDDLVKRLRDKKRGAGFDFEREGDRYKVATLQMLPDPDCLEAADRIEELERERSIEFTAAQHCLKAARREALEEAARVADGRVQNAEDWDSSYWNQCAMGIAAAIRALKEGK